MVLADISIKRPIFITVIFIVLLIVGGISYNGLTINDMPQADMPYVTVTIVQKGASVEQMESKVAKYVEEAVGEISGVKHITSTIMESVSMTMVEFNLEKSPDVAAQEIRDKVSGIRSKMPSDIEDPTIVKFDVTAKPIISLVVTGDVNALELSRIADDVIAKDLYTVKGVGAIDLFGKSEREIQIKLDNYKMVSYGITTPEVLNAFKGDNLEIPGGKVTDKDQEISIRTNANINSVKEFNNILVGKRNGIEVRLGDIAEVIDGEKDRETLCRFQGEEAIGIDIIKQSGANIVSLADKITEQINKIKEKLPKGINVEIVRDNSVAIRDSVNEVNKTILEGCILAIIIVFIFLREWQSTLISAISLPTSIVTTFIAMKLFGFSLNTLSLMALSLSVGLLIDDAIVVIENIVRHLEMGKSPIKAAKEATSEIGLAVLATTLAVVAVFVPVAMVEGMIGQFFIEFGITVACSILVSLFVSFTLVPLMSAKILKISHKKSKSIFGKALDWFNDTFDRIADKYAKLLKRVLKLRFVTLTLCVVLFVGSLSVIPLLGFAFIPSTDNGEIEISADLDSGLTLDNVTKKTKGFEKILSSYKEIKYTYATLEKDNISIFIKLVDKSQRVDNSKVISERIRKDFKDIPGIELTVMPVSSGPAGAKEIAYNITGDDFEELKIFAYKAKKILEKDPNARDVAISYKAGQPEATLVVDRDKASDLGVNIANVGSVIRTLFNGVDVGKFEEGTETYDVRVSIKDEQRKKINDLDEIYVMSSSNKLIQASEVVNKEFTTGSSALRRYDRTLQIELSANVYGISSGDFLNSYLNILNNETDMPSSVNVSMGGMNATMQEGFSSLLTAMIIGIILIFLVMAAQFESFIDPIAIMFALPMALIGAVGGLYVAGSQLSIMSLIGVIMLMGLVAKNAILLIDFAKMRREEGIGRDEALVEAGNIRLRPIVMTTLAMIFGMLPLALAQGAGTEMRAPMAHAVIGGLITSTLLTLFIVPVMYSLLDDFKKIFTKKKAKA